GRCPPTAGPSPVPRGRPGGLLCSRCRCACGEERCSSWRRLRLFLWRRGRGGEWAGDLGRQSPQECEPGEDERADGEHRLDRGEPRDRAGVAEGEQRDLVAHRAAHGEPGEDPAGETHAGGALVSRGGGVVVTTLFRFITF